MRKKDVMTPVPLRDMFEQILSDQLKVKEYPGTFVTPFVDSPDWRNWKQFCPVIWVEEMVEEGLIIQDGEPERPNGVNYRYYRFRVTEKGMKWWFREWSKEVSDRSKALRELFERGQVGKTPSLEFAGIGKEFYYSFFYGDAPLVFVGLDEGYFKFEHFYSYRHGIADERYLIVALTLEGMRFFDSLPRLELECA